MIISDNKSSSAKKPAPKPKQLNLTPMPGTSRGNQSQSSTAPSTSTLATLHESKARASRTPRSSRTPNTPASKLRVFVQAYKANQRKNSTSDSGEVSTFIFYRLDKYNSISDK